MAKGGRKVVLTDPINRLDLSSLSDIDKLQIEMLQAAYDRAGSQAVAKGMARLARTHPELFGWLVQQLIEQRRRRRPRRVAPADRTAHHAGAYDPFGRTQPSDQRKALLLAGPFRYN
jgi:hypothetical protein